MSDFHPLRELFLARMRQFFREPTTIFWVYFFPLLLMIALGIAFAERRQGAVTVRVSAAVSGRAEELASSLKAASASGGPEFRVEAVPLAGLDDADSENRWDITVILRDGRLEYRFDPARPESHLAYLRVDRALQEAAGRADPIPSRFVAIQEPGQRYIDWLIPGLLGLNIMGGGLWGVGFVAVDMRIRKLLKRFQATPMRRSDFMVCLVGARLVFLIPELIAILSFGHFAFDLEIRGDLLSVVAVAFLGAASFAGLGLLVACRAQRLETISGLMNAVMLPMWMLSGVFFSAQRFPDAMQPIVQALPLTQLNNALRAVILGGDAVHEQWPALLVLCIWGAVCFPLALRWFRWQ